MREQGPVEGIIYKVTFPNNKMYIGQTYKGLDTRKAEHKLNMKKYDYPFYRALRKYGFDSVTWEIIDTANSVSELDEKEMYYIKKFKTYIGFKDSQGYNANLGGNRNAVLGPLNDEQLKEFGEDYRSGMSKDEMWKKYGQIIKRKYIFNSIFVGRQWNEFTNIEDRRKFSEKGANSKLSTTQVDVILEKFKESGITRRVADEMGLSIRVVRNVILGKTWSEYTGIIDNSFYEKYASPSCICTKKEVEKIIIMKKQGKTEEEIKGEFPQIRPKTIKAILSGNMWQNTTNFDIIKRTEEDNRIKPINAKITIKDVDIILELHKNGDSSLEISRKTGITPGTVLNVINGKTWGKYTGITPEKYKEQQKRKIEEKIKEKEDKNKEKIMKNVIQELKVHIVLKKFQDGQSVASACKEIGISESCYYQRRRKYM